jgi:short-subunit dehydrogenase
MARQDEERELALVTGASSGIGYELAHQCARHGFELVLAAEDDRIHDVGREFQARGVRNLVVQADLSTNEGLDLLHEQVLEHGGTVDILALNAGVGLGGPFLTTDLLGELSMIHLNCVAPVYLAKLFIPDMVYRRRGHVLITSSMAAGTPAPFEAVYGATRAFLLSFAETVRNELEGTGVTVTALQPGPTDTAALARAAFDALMEGREQVVSGLRSKLQVLSTTEGSD